MDDNQITYEETHNQTKRIYNYSQELYKEGRYHD